MKVLVIGGGVIGISTAYYLANSGAKVTVIDRNSELGMESSYANGAQLSYSHSDPWSSKSNLLKAMKWMFKQDAPLYFRPMHALKALPWVMQFVFEAKDSRYFHNARAINALSFYSRDLMIELQNELQLDFDFSDAGILHFYSNARALEEDRMFFEYLKSFNDQLIVSALKAKEVMDTFHNMEHVTKRKVGAIYCQNDHLGDIHKFTIELAKVCERMGVEIINGVTCNDFIMGSGKINKVILNNKEYRFDKYVLAAGAYSSLIAKKTGVSLPIYPMKGYSLTATTVDPSMLPEPSITDHTSKIVLTPLRNAIRVAGTAEFGGFDHTINKCRIVPLIKSLRRNFPNIGYDKKIEISEFACLRSQTPRSYPYICRTKIKNLFVNTGHGSLGWTQALGSAKLISDIINCKQTDINSDTYK